MISYDITYSISSESLGVDLSMILTFTRVQNLCRNKENQAQGRNRLARDHRPECNQIKTQPWSPDFLSHNILS